MKVMKQLLIVVIFALVGNLLSYLLSLMNFHFPGSLIGLILLFLFFLTGIIKSDGISQVG